MAYHSALYLFAFLPMALLAYQLTPQKKRWIMLLLFGYVFFWIFSKQLVLFLIGTSVFTHYIGVWIAGQESKKTKKPILLFGIFALLSVLVYMKYFNFFVMNTNTLLGNLGSNVQMQTHRILIPLGISFYTMQAISYMVDVYWGKIKAENHLGKVALFLGFFPQLMEGPISMYSQTADALWEAEPLKSENLVQGSIRIAWGLFKKMIIADRLYVMVQTIFTNYAQYSGIVIIVGAIAYTVQLYMEFSGSIDMVIGSGKMFGVMIPANFRQPFFAKNASEFWQRWHITLGAWFKTYIFYPISVSRIVKKWNHFGKKHWNKYVTKLGVSAMCLFPVWLCNGLWHGPQWNYIFYGMYYFVILLLGIAVEPIHNKVIRTCRINEKAQWFHVCQILKTWVIIFTGELFFRANGLRAGMAMFRSIFKPFEWELIQNGFFLTLGIDCGDFAVIILGCIIVAIVGFIKERKLLKPEALFEFCTPVRWAIYYSLILSVVIFGAYGIGYQPVDLIYAGF